jgi:Ca-activated chloride channel family protein
VLLNHRSSSNGPTVVSRGLAALTVALVLSWPAPCPAGDRPPGSASAPATGSRQVVHTERERVRLVLLPVSVLDGRGRARRGLSAEDFVLHEDGVPQEIGYFGTEEDQPISLAFLLDVSGSMRQPGKLDSAKWAVRNILDELEPADRAGMICFADEQVTWVTEFTTDRDRFLRRLDVQHGYGRTALFDALAAAPRLVNEIQRGRRAIVLLTDGFDNSSDLNLYEATRAARRTGVPIYTIGFVSVAETTRPAGSKSKGWRALELFSRETGGRMFQVRDAKDLTKALERIERELRLQYLIGYYPSRREWNGKFRRIKLETTRGGSTVRTRTGYYADP